jgi:hypothetical protein
MLDFLTNGAAYLFPSGRMLKLIVASVANPNPITVGSAIHLISELYENG